MDSIAGIYLKAAFILLSILLCIFSIKKPFIFPFGAYVFLIPFDSVLSITGSSQGATLTKFLGLMTMAVLLFKGALEDKLKPLDFTAILWMFFILFGLLSILWAIQPELVASRIPTALGLLLFYLIVAAYQLQRSEYEILKRFILLGGLIAAIYSIYTYSSSPLYTKAGRATMIIGERMTNENTFAFSLLLPVSVCIEMMLKQSKKIIKSLYMIILGLFLYSILITGSRGALLGIAIVIIIYIHFLKQRLTLGTITMIIGIILISIIPEFFIERWAQSLETGGAGRLDIWRVGLEALGEYYLIGAGLSNFPAVFSKYFWGVAKDPHNTYLGIFLELGVVGISLMIFGIIKHYRLIRCRFGEHFIDNVMLKAAFWAILVSSFFSTFIWTKSFWLILMMIMMYRNLFSVENESERNITPTYN